MSDRVCVMREGRIVQAGSPRELYDRPVNRYVADFVGKTNFFAGPSADRGAERPARADRDRGQREAICPRASRRACP